LSALDEFSEVHLLNADDVTLTCYYLASVAYVLAGDFWEKGWALDSSLRMLFSGQKLWLNVIQDICLLCFASFLVNKVIACVLCLHVPYFSSKYVNTSKCVYLPDFAGNSRTAVKITAPVQTP